MTLQQLSGAERTLTLEALPHTMITPGGFFDRVLERRTTRPERNR